MNAPFDFELEKVVQTVQEKHVKRVLIQLPEGMKQYAPSILTELQSQSSAEFLVSGDSTWGGCDLALDEAKSLKADLLVHFGHAQFVHVDFPVLYVEVKDTTDLTPLLVQSLDSIKGFSSLGIVSSIQHLHQLASVKAFYEQHGKTVQIPAKKGFAAYNGHVVGCEYNSLKAIQSSVDCFVVLGNTFHSLGAALSVQKPVFLVDTYNAEVSSMESLKQKILKQRAIAIGKIKDAKIIGILVGSKVGQKFGQYSLIQNKLEALGKQVLVLTINEFTPEKILNFYHVEGFIQLACPRIAIEDYGKYERPLITYREAQVVLGTMQWEDLVEQGLL